MLMNILIYCFYLVLGNFETLEKQFPEECEIYLSVYSVYQHLKLFPFILLSTKFLSTASVNKVIKVLLILLPYSLSVYPKEQTLNCG